MKNVFTIIKKEFSRFFRDRRMVVTVLLPGLLIYILYSLMGSVFSDYGKVDENYKYTAAIVNCPVIFAEFVDQNLELKEMDETEARDAVTSGELDLFIVFPEDFDGIISGYGEDAPSDVHIYYNSTKDNSVNGYMIVSAYLEYFKNPSFTINTDGTDSFDLAEDRQSAAKILSMLMPMLMFALLASACIAVAPESIAGEKERGTMATMLITPVKRWQIALGKIVSLTCFALMSGISSFIGVIFSLPKLMGGFVGSETAAFYSAGDYFMILGLIISIVLVIISAFSVLSAFAKSVKEAGTLITPLMMLIILLGLVSMFISSAPATGLYAIPVLGSGLAISSVMSFAITPLAFVFAVFSNVILAAALITVLSFMFRSEKIMFGR